MSSDASNAFRNRFVVVSSVVVFLMIMVWKGDIGFVEHVQNWGFLTGERVSVHIESLAEFKKNLHNGHKDPFSLELPEEDLDVDDSMLRGDKTKVESFEEKLQKKVEKAEEAASRAEEGGFGLEEEIDSTKTDVDNEVAIRNKTSGKIVKRYIPGVFDWLHIPKTGTSFILSMLLYQCDHKLQGMLAKNPKADIIKLLEKLAMSIRTGGNRDICANGLRYFHHSLDQSEQRGHSSKSGRTVRKVRDVASIFRHPMSRIASALVNELHDCNGQSKSGPNAKQICTALTDPDLPSERREFIERRVLKFANCISGCGTRMHVGGGCAHPRESTNLHGNFNVIVPKAIRKMKQFAFVGLTDRWAESMCLFSEMFPRPSGKPYPRKEVNKNVRPSVSHLCEKEVEKILEKNDWHDVLDEAVYEATKERFLKDLEQFPQCKQGKTSHA